MAYKSNMSDLEVIGRNLEFERLRTNMTRKDFAKLIKYDRGSYSKLAKNKNQDIELDSLVKIARSLDIDLAILLSRSYIDDYKERKVEESHFVEHDYQILLADNLRAALNERGLCQEIGTNRETVNRLINYHIKNPRISTISMIAAELSMSLSSLFKGGNVL